MVVGDEGDEQVGAYVLIEREMSEVPKAEGVEEGLVGGEIECGQGLFRRERGGAEGGGQKRELLLGRGSLLEGRKLFALEGGLSAEPGRPEGGCRCRCRCRCLRLGIRDNDVGGSGNGGIFF